MNVIDEMRDRLTERFRGAAKPLSGFRVTANNMPRLPQSKIPQPRPRYDRVGRPPKAQKELPPLKKPKNIFEGWL